MPDTVWHNWRWDVAAGICAGIYQGCIWTFALQIARGTMHASGFQMGVASAAPAVGYLFAILWARQMEGRSKLPFVTVTWLLSRGLFLLTPLIVRSTGHTIGYIGLICLTPILFSVSTPAYTAIMKDIYPDQLRGRLMSYVRVGMALSMLVTARVMGILQEHHGLDFRWMFFIGGLFGIGTAVAFSRLRLPAVLHSGELPPFGHFLRQTFGILNSNVGYRWFCVSVFLAGFGNLLQTPAQYVVQVDRFSITPTQIATMQNIAGLLSLASLFFWGWYMDRFGSLPTVLAAVSINCIAPLVYAFAPSLFWLYLAAASMGVSASGIDLGYLNTTLMFAEPGRAAQYQAVHSTLFGLRGTIAPLLTFAVIGLLRRNWAAFFLMCLAIMVVGTLFQFFSMRTYRRQAAPA
jgi:MFS transporter, DHA1 family, staphyloferrin B biosynthesis exporter